MEGRFKSTEFIEFKNFRYKIQDAIIRGGGKFNLLDSQFYNPHLLQFGAYEISNTEYQEKLKNGINKKNVFLENYDYQESISTLHSISHKS